MKAKWYGPKQILMIIFTGILLLIDACIVGGSTNTVLPALAEAHGWNANLLNVFAGVGCCLDGLGVLFWAKFARKSAKKLAGVGLFIEAACLIVFGYTNSLAVLAVMIFVMGLGGSMFASTAVNTLTANWWPTKKGVVFGYSTMGIILMSVVYAPYMPAAYAAIGIGKTNLFLAIFIAVMGVISILFVKDTPEEAGTTPDGMTGLDLTKSQEIIKEMEQYQSPFTIGKMLRNPVNWCVTLTMGITLMVAMTYIATTIPALLSYGYDYGIATLIFSVGGVIALVGSWLLGMLDQIIGTKKTVIIFVCIMLVGAICCLFMAQSLLAAWMSGMIFMFTNGGAKNLLPSYVGTLYGRWDYPAAYRMIGTIALVMCGLGVMITGFFPSYRAMYIFDIVAVVIALILAIIIKDKFIGKADLNLKQGDK